MKVGKINYEKESRKCGEMRKEKSLDVRMRCEIRKKV
jgi:hypothetical protein